MANRAMTRVNATSASSVTLPQYMAEQLQRHWSALAIPSVAMENRGTSQCPDRCHLQLPASEHLATMRYLHAKRI